MAVLKRQATSDHAKWKSRKDLITKIILVSAQAAFVYGSKRFSPEPYHTSILTGKMWVDEMLEGHEGRMRRQLGMHRHVFRCLVNTLRRLTFFDDTKYVTADEQLAIFLYGAVKNASVRTLAERFQRSLDTISRVFHRVLSALTSDNFRNVYLRLPSASSALGEYVRSNPKLYPFFKDALGGIDGSHIPFSPTEEDRARYRDRDGNISQNFLAACDFDMRFIYALSSWEGSASDSQIFEHARLRDLKIPPGKYFLADAGFPACDQLLVPYRGVRYHLREWGIASIRPKDYKELFNLRHAQARNVVERIFGLAKRKFKMFREATEYPPHTQARIIPALCEIINFIRIHDPDDSPDGNAEDELPSDAAHRDLREEDVAVVFGITRAETQRAAARRDAIAHEMWESYQTQLARRQ